MDYSQAQRAHGCHLCGGVGSLIGRLTRLALKRPSTPARGTPMALALPPFWRSGGGGVFLGVWVSVGGGAGSCGDEREPPGAGFIGLCFCVVTPSYQLILLMTCIVPVVSAAEVGVA